MDDREGLRSSSVSEQHNYNTEPISSLLSSSVQSLMSAEDVE